MADDSNKVTIELDLDSGAFVAKMGEAENAFGGLKDKGTESFGELGAAAVVLNQGIELCTKAVELFEAGMRQIEKAEVLTNQETAFKNLTASIGVSSNEMLAAIKTATGGTVSQVDAISASMKLLSAGMRADQIPAFLELAHNMSIAHGNAQEFMGVVDATASSLTRGATRGMAQFGVSADVTGNKTAVLSTIMKQLQAEVDRTGNNFDDFAEKLKAKSTDTWNAVTKMVGGTLSTILKPLIGDDIDKASVSLEKLNGQLKAIQSAMASGAQNFVIQKDGMAQIVPIQEAYNTVQKQIADQNGIISKTEEDKKAKLDAYAESTKNADVIVKSLSLSERDRALVAAEVLAAGKRVADEASQDAMTQKAAYDDLYKAKVAMITKEINDRKTLITSTATSEQDLTNKLVALEEEKYKRIRSIRITADQIKTADDEAELQYVQKNLLTMDDAVKRSIQVQTNAETLRFTQEKQQLANSGLSYQDYLKKIEAATEQHEQKVLQIKKSYDNVSKQNLQLGINDSLSKMRAQYTSFEAMVSDATTKTHGIMTNAFVAMAKGHGDAMQLMVAQFLEMIGTKMIESGTFHLLEGIATFNGAEIGAGTGLIAAGSALVGAGAANTPSSSSSSGSSSTTAAGGTSSTSTTTTATAAAAAPVQKSQASIVIQGDFLNSRETANHLAEILRQNSDITDYAIVAQGQSYGAQ